MHHQVDLHVQLNCYLTCSRSFSLTCRWAFKWTIRGTLDWTNTFILISTSKKNKYIFLTFFSQFYQQTDDVAMRGPASSTTAEIYMHAYERTAITTALHPAKVWEWFVDDVYSILKRTHLKTFSIISTIFIKILSLLWRKKVMEN